MSISSRRMAPLKPFILRSGLIAILAAVGCSSSDEAGRPAATAAEDVAGANACLLDYATRYDELLPLALAAEVSGLPAGEARTDYSTRHTSNPARQQVNYRWPSDRVQTHAVMGQQVSVPVSNHVALGGMEATTRELFLATYRVMTAEERAEVARAIDESDEEALQTEEARDLAQGLAGIAADLTQGYRAVPGVGQEAAYNTTQSMLYVFDRGVSFFVLVELGDDHDANQAKAVEIARRALAHCP